MLLSRTVRLVVFGCLICAVSSRVLAQQDGSLSAELSDDGVLTVSGNSVDDEYHLLIASVGPDRVRVLSTSVGVLADYPAVEVTQVDLVLGAGPDTLLLMLGGRADIHVDTGLGGDHIVLGSPWGGVTHVGDVYINTGHGADRVTFNSNFYGFETYFQIDGDMTILTGQGSDLVQFGAEYTDLGFANFGGTLMIHTGGDNDRIVKSPQVYVHVQSDLSAVGGQGNDYFDFFNDSVSAVPFQVDGIASFSGDQGFDVLRLEYVEALWFEIGGFEVLTP